MLKMIIRMEDVSDSLVYRNNGNSTDYGRYFKAINFGLDTHQLKAHYPGVNYRYAYDDLRQKLCSKCVLH